MLIKHKEGCILAGTMMTENAMYFGLTLPAEIASSTGDAEPVECIASGWAVGIIYDNSKRLLYSWADVELPD